ncbi:MAG: tRNA (N6-isopentenyl adenosine(37)-C2)-methylthiotransferase MiaB [Candidatus Omnitrophota bacterium]|jgi:tRNA-2-methylthio-N6-dimethylallyladenosine synthase
MNNKEISKKKVFLRTFGCQMNARDSEFVMGIMLESGFSQASSIEKADVIIFNSCSVRKHAEDRLFSNITELKDLKKIRPGIVIGLMGCAAQSYKEKALRRAPLVNFVCGPGDEYDLPRIIKDVLENGCSIVATDKVSVKRPEMFPKYREGGFKAYVSIGEGCNNFCSYCIVPYVRGRERSRHSEDITREVKDLASRGFKEITLLGQNVNSYEGKNKDKGFVGLLEKLNAVKGVEWIRFMTSHPKDASINLFKAMRDLEKVCEHLHLPAQSGSTRILKLMNRGYTKGHYLKLVEDYKKILPGGAITTDVIVGFPSETESDFKDTIDLVRRIKFDSAYTFKYSSRPPAKSARLKDDVSDEAKSTRLTALMEIQGRISEERNTALLGKAYEVLVDGRNGKDPSKLTGRTRTNKIVVFAGDEKLIGKIVNVKIESVTPYALKGKVV